MGLEFDLRTLALDDNAERAPSPSPDE